jgi:dGTP triphosphohydrolase
MSPLKVAIFTEVKKTHDEASGLSDENLNKLIFHHPDGLRLSLNGFLVIKKIFTAYSFEIPDTLKSKHQYALSKMEYPYFFTKRRLIVFSEMDATMITLQGGIQSFLEAICN